MLGGVLELVVMGGRNGTAMFTLAGLTLDRDSDALFLEDNDSGWPISKKEKKKKTRQAQ